MGRRVICLVLLVLCSTRAASGDVRAYPVPWPRAFGGTVVAVPTADATVHVYHRVGTPSYGGFDQPFPLTTPAMTIAPALADTPIILMAPALPAQVDANQDDFYILLSDQPLIVSMADDERYQPGSPDRIFFMPATSG